VLDCTAEATDMAQREGTKLRRELDRVEGRQGRCFPPELKLRAARWIAERRAGGAPVAEIAAELSSGGDGAAVGQRGQTDAHPGARARGGGSGSGRCTHG
jgi:hypothetical protein